MSSCTRLCRFILARRAEGVNGICMRVFDTTVALVNCHLTASIGKAGAEAPEAVREVVDRREQARDEYLQLHGQFPHRLDG